MPGEHMVAPYMQGLGLLWWAHPLRLDHGMVARQHEARAEDRGLKQEIVVRLETLGEQSCFVNT